MFNFRDYLDFAEKQVMIAEEELRISRDANWALIPAIILAWSAIESFVNNRSNDFASLPENVLHLHERSLLLEKKIHLIDSGDRLGQFELEGKEYHRIEDKIFFLIAKFGGVKGKKVIKGDRLWQEFTNFKNTRDALVHPRQDNDIELNVEMAREYIQTSKDVIQFISTNIWKTKIQF